MSDEIPPGGTPTDALPDGTPIIPDGGTSDPPPYEPPKGDEPWYGHLADVPEVLQPTIVGAFREFERNANARIEKLTPYEELVNAGIDPQTAVIAAEFAQMLYGEPDPGNAIATQHQKEAQLRFYQQYGDVLRQRGYLSDPTAAAAEAEAQRQQQLEREMETPEQRTIRELREKQDELLALQAQQGEFITQQQQAQTQAVLTDAFKQEWQQVIAANGGPVSKREFAAVQMLANQDPDPSPGVIRRAYDKMLATFGHLPDPEAPGGDQPRPPVAAAAGAAAAIPVPGAPDLRFGTPEGRHNRRQVALEAMKQLEQEGAPAV